MIWKICGTNSLGKDDDNGDAAFVDDQVVEECKSVNSLSLVGKLLLRKL